MDVYLGVDGVLKSGDKAALFADDLLALVLMRWPDSTFWLSAHCWRGSFSVPATLKPLLMKQTLRQLHKVKKTDWHDLKTDAIDFRRPFVWLGSTLTPDERIVLETYGKQASFRRINLVDHPNQLLDEIVYLKQLRRPYT